MDCRLQRPTCSGTWNHTDKYMGTLIGTRERISQLSHLKLMNIGQLIILGERKNTFIEEVTNVR